MQSPPSEGSAEGVLAGLRRRPICLGLSIGHPRGTGGSIGPFVRLPDGKPGFISTSTVLAPSHALRPGDYIHQPGPRDAEALTGGTRIAQLTSFFTVLTEGSPHLVDAAIAGLLDDVEWQGNVVPDPAPDAGATISAIAEPKETLLGAPVAFVGRTSGYSAGHVTALDLTFRISSGTSLLTFAGCIEIAGEADEFSRAGDSGALVYRFADHAAIGLVFASRRDPSGVVALMSGTTAVL